MGTKHLFELIPGGLKKRIKQDRRKLWDEQQSLSVAKAWSDLSKHSKSPKPSSKAASPEALTSASTDGTDSQAAQANDKDIGSKDSKHQSSQQLIKEELQARVDLLKELAEGYDDPGTPAVHPPSPLLLPLLLPYNYQCFYPLLSLVLHSAVLPVKPCCSCCTNVATMAATHAITLTLDPGPQAVVADSYCITCCIQGCSDSHDPQGQQP